MKNDTKNNYIYDFVIIFEINKIMTVMIIQNQELVFICYTKFNIILKMM